MDGHCRRVGVDKHAFDIRIRLLCTDFPDWTIDEKSGETAISG